MQTWKLTGAAIPNGVSWYISGFENGTSDYDYNDYVFLFQNTIPAGVPEPGSIALTLLGFVALLGRVGSGLLACRPGFCPARTSAVSTSWSVPRRARKLKLT